MYPGARRGANPQNDVGRKERSEEHDFRREEKPDSNLGIVKAGVLAGLYDVGDVHAVAKKRFCGVR